MFIVTLDQVDHSLQNGSRTINIDKLMIGDLEIQKNDEKIPNLKIDQINSQENIITYNVEQNETFIIETTKIKSLVSNYNTNISFQAEVINSSFEIASTENNNSNEWMNGIEPDYGEVNFSLVTSDDKNYTRLNFTNNNDPPGYGITNTIFNVSSNPNVVSHSTNISFDFQIPSITPALLSSIHTLALEFRFNNGSFYYVLSSFGGSYEGIQKDNMIRPNLTNNVYIYCNKTPPFEWNHVSSNITKIITDPELFSPQEYDKFANLKTLFCYLITFDPDFNLSLDLDNLTYSSLLSSNNSIDYSIGETIVSTTNGSLFFDDTLGNCTFSPYDNSIWSTNLLTYIIANISRIFQLETPYIVELWNETHVTTQIDLNFPQIIENPHSSVIHMVLPSDWTNFRFINDSIQFSSENHTIWLNNYITAKEYHFNVLGMDNVTFEAQAPNYLTNIIAPVNIQKNELLDIRGEIRYPLSEQINLFLHNSSFIFHRTTLPMVNSTFIFSDIIIGEQFPLGLLHFTLNWSSSFEFGIYDVLIYIHEEFNQTSTITIHTSKNISIYRFEPLYVNISLYLDSNPYWTNEAFVFLLERNECINFTRKSQNNYILNISSIQWEPGEYLLQIYASDRYKYFATDTIQLFIEPASVYWNFENLPSFIIEGDNLTFRLYSFINSEEGDKFITLPGLEIRMWVNDTAIVYYETNSDGYIDININISEIISEDWLSLIITGMLDQRIVKIQYVSFFMSNLTAVHNKNRAYLSEILKSPIKANSTFHIHYQVDYSSNGTAWYIPIDSISKNIVSAYILRENFVIGTQLEDKILSWNLYANQSVKDTLVIELFSPTVSMKVESVSSRFRIKIETYSDITINNYSIELDFEFLGLPFSNLSLLDSINREIMDFYPITVSGYHIEFTKLNIIASIPIIYYIEGYLENIELLISHPFESVYIYNDSITGSWMINVPIEFEYSVFYTISNSTQLICHNTSIKELSNSSYIITASLPKQQWNKSFSVYLKAYFFSKLEIVSITQHFKIIDPYPPVINYFVESYIDYMIIHAFLFEPEGASGVKQVICQIDKENRTFLLDSKGHFTFNLTHKVNSSQIARIVAIDWAGNIQTSAYIEISEYISKNPILNVFDIQFIFSVIFSSVTLGGIGITRMIRKRSTSVL